MTEFIVHFRNEKGGEAEMCLAMVSGIAIGEAPVSYWPISPLPRDSPRSLRESLLSPASVSFLKGRMTTQRNGA